MAALTKLALAATCFATLIRADTNLLTNPGFEAPVLIVSPDFASIPTGWTRPDNGSNSGSLFMETYSSFGLPALTGGGNQALGFGANGGEGGTISQSFNTISGTSYEVAFNYVLQQGTEIQGLKAEALNGASSLKVDAFDFSNIAWAQATFDFTATGSTSTLQISDTFPNQGVFTNWALDNVSVTSLTSGPSQVPEPSSLAVLGIAALAMAGVRAARRKNA
jgi:hypothetical protein